MLCVRPTTAASSQAAAATAAAAAAAMPFGRPDGLSAKDKRIFMAKVFEKTQNTMSKTVDDIGLRPARPCRPSKWEAKYDVAERGRSRRTHT